MDNMRNHPIIENLERTGYPNGKEPKFPICSVCGEETDTLYVDIYIYMEMLLVVMSVLEGKMLGIILIIINSGKCLIVLYPLTTIYHVYTDFNIEVCC